MSRKDVINVIWENLHRRGRPQRDRSGWSGPSRVSSRKTLHCLCTTWQNTNRLVPDRRHTPNGQTRPPPPHWGFLRALVGSLLQLKTKRNQQLESSPFILSNNRLSADVIIVSHFIVQWIIVIKFGLFHHNLFGYNLHPILPML